jgi:hypothetical protein
MTLTGSRSGKPLLARFLAARTHKPRSCPIGVATSLTAMSHRITIIACLVLCLGNSAWAAAKQEQTVAGYAQYKDPLGRFIFDYPATMKVRGADPDQVTVFHQGATLRISVYVEKRPRKGDSKVEPLLEAFKKRLKEDVKEPTILEEGKTPGSRDSQGYIICSFKDQRGVDYVQLVHYCVGEERVLQMIISDRTAGFKNLAPVIRKIHQSLKIIDPKLGS